MNFQDPTSDNSDRTNPSDFRILDQARALYESLNLEMVVLAGQLYGIGLIESEDVKRGRMDLYGVMREGLLIAELEVQVTNNGYWWDGEPTHSILKFQVDESFRGAGWATRLMDKFLADVEKTKSPLVDHNGQTKLGERWWQRYSRTRNIDPKRHLNTQFAPSTEASVTRQKVHISPVLEL